MSESAGAGRSRALHFRRRGSKVNFALQKWRYYAVSAWRLLACGKPWFRIPRVMFGAAGAGPHRIVLRDSGLRFLVRDAMDVWCVKETFIDRFYERFGIAVEDGWMVIDIGGGIGDFAIFAAHQRPDTRVFSFEPTPGSYRCLEANLRDNGITNVLPFKEAVWSHTGALCIDTGAGTPLAYATRSTTDATAGSLEVPCVSLADVLARLDGRQCDLMKLDCEGAEYTILFEAPDDVLRSVRRLVMEYHDDNEGTGRTHRDLERCLTAKGFVVRIQPNWVHRHLGYLYAESTTLQR